MIEELVDGTLLCCGFLVITITLIAIMWWYYRKVHPSEDEEDLLPPMELKFEEYEDLKA